MANLFWISAAQVYEEHGAGPHSAANLLAWYGWTFTRADSTTCATWLDNEGVIQTAPAGYLRLEYDSVISEWGFLLEGSRVSGWTKVRKQNDGAWTKANLTGTADNVIGPWGTVTAAKFTEDAPNAAKTIRRSLTGATDNQPQAFIFQLRPNGRQWIRLSTFNKAGVSADSWVDIINAVKGTVAGSHVILSVKRLANSFVRIHFQLTSIASGGSSPLMDVLPATADNSTATFGGDGVTGFWAEGFHWEVDKAFAGSIIDSDASAVTRAADSLTVPFAFGPTDCTIWIRMSRPVWADASGDIGLFPTPLTLGGVNDPNKRIEISGVQGSRTWQSRFGDSGSQATVAIPAGNILSLSTQCKNPATAPAVAVDAGSGLGSFDTGAPTFTAYADQTIRIPHTSAQLYGVLLDLKGRQGLNTLAAMATEPSFAPVNPFEVTDFDVPGPLISKAQSGRVNTRNTQQIGRTWTEHYLLQVSQASHREFLARMRQYWGNGTIFAKGHIDYATMKGVGGGTPKVQGASQTGSTLIVDGCPANTANWLRAGDIFRVQGLAQALECAADVNTEGDGRALIPLTRPLFTGGSPSDNAGLTITAVTLDVSLLEPPSFPATSGRGSDYGELVLKFTEAL